MGFEPLSEDGSAYASLLRGEIFGFNCWCLLTYFVVLVFFLTMNSSTDCQPTSPVITAQGPCNKIYVAVKSTGEHNPTLAQLVERRTVVVADKSLGRWFESGRSDFFVFFSHCILTNHVN